MGDNSYSKCSFANGILRYKGRIVVGNEGDIKIKVVKTAHDSCFENYTGI